MAPQPIAFVHGRHAIDRAMSLLALAVEASQKCLAMLPVKLTFHRAQVILSAPPHVSPLHVTLRVFIFGLLFIVLIRLCRCAERLRIEIFSSVCCRKAPSLFIFSPFVFLRTSNLSPCRCALFPFRSHRRCQARSSPARGCQVRAGQVRREDPRSPSLRLVGVRERKRLLVDIVVFAGGVVDVNAGAFCSCSERQLE